MSCGALCYVLGSVRGIAAHWRRGQEMVSGAGRARIQATGGLDGVRTELTPQPSKICKWTKALDGTSLESGTCSRLTRAGVKLQ